MRKIIAYLLIFVGLVLMFFAFMAMHQAFINKKPVVQVVTAKPVALHTQYGIAKIDAGVLVHTLNLVLFAVLMSFLVFLGAKVAAIGNQLLKTECICDALAKLRSGDALAHEKDIQRL